MKLAAYPNPFNPKVVLRYELAQARSVTVSILDTRGRVLRVFEQGMRPAGSYELVWDGMDGSGKAVASGVYLAEMQAGDERLSRKLSLLR